MFNIGFSELIILGIIGLLVIGPEQLPDMARKLAKILNELKRAKEDIFSPMEDLKQEAQKKIESIRTELDQKLHSDVSQSANKTAKDPKDESIG